MGAGTGKILRERDQVSEECYWAYMNGGENMQDNRKQIGKIRGLAHEVVINTKYSLPIWNGIMSKAWTTMLIIGGIDESKIKTITRKIRKILGEFRNSVWKKRTEIMYGEEREDNQIKKKCKDTQNSTQKKMTDFGENNGKHKKIGGKM